jgi:methyl-accepting chemotaxis protein
MRIKTRLTLTISAASAIAVVLAGFMAERSWQALSDTKTAQSLLRLELVTLKLSESLTIEHGAINQALLLDAALPAPLAGEIDRLSHNTDADLAAFRRSVAAERPALGAAAAVVQTALQDIDKIDDLRTRSEAAARQLKSARTVTAAAYVGEVAPIITSLENMTLAIGARMASIDADAAQLLEVARQSWRLRALAGEKGPLLAQIIAGPTPTPAAALEKVATVDGHIGEAWFNLLALQRRLGIAGQSGVLGAAVGDVQDKYIDGLSQVYAGILAAGRAGKPYGLTPQQLRSRQLPSIQETLKVRDAALADAAGVLHERSRTASLQLLAAVGLILAVLIFAGVGLLVTNRYVSRPAAVLAVAVGRMRDGELTLDVPGQDRADELGAVAKAIDMLRQQALHAQELSRNAALEQERKEKRQQTIAAHIEGFERSIAGALSALASASTQLGSTARSMNTTASETERRSTAVASASEEASASVQTVASATEELAASISEISRQVAQSARIAGQAVDEARQTDTQINGLVEAAQRIGDVERQKVRLSRDVIDQLDDATIEAARAGRQGLRRGRLRGEKPGDANRAGDRRYRRPGRRHPGRDQRGGRRHPADFRHYRANQRGRHDHCLGRRGTGSGDPGDRAQRPAGLNRHGRGVRRYRRRQQGGRRDGRSGRSRATRRHRARPAGRDAAQRSRPLPRQHPRGVGNTHHNFIPSCPDLFHGCPVREFRLHGRGRTTRNDRHGRACHGHPSPDQVRGQARSRHVGRRGCAGQARA